MAHLIATADGNLTAAATWGVVDATSLLDDNATNVTALTTAYVESATFTPGAITIDGIAVHVTVRAAVPASETMSVRLAQAGVTVTGTEVTINVSDISARDGEQGWYFFKFAAPVLLLAATLYTVSAKTSAASMVTIRRNATAGNWQRMLRTTTTGAPIAGDTMFVLGEWTAGATKTNRAVTMDETATTDYGNASTVSHRASLGVGLGGTVTSGVTAATAYRLRLSGLLLVWHGGTLNLGTTIAPMPRDSSVLVEFDCAADGDFGLKAYGTLVCQGQSRTAAKLFVQCLLNTDEAAAQTVLGVDTDTGWKSGDEIAIASTTRTAADAETRTLTGDAGASSMTVTVGLTNAHSGTSPTQAEVALITRNVRIESVSTTFMAYVFFGFAAAVDCDWTLFRYMGTASVSDKGGIEFATTTGSVTLDFCCIANFDAQGIITAASGAPAWDNVHIRNLTGWKVGNQSTNHAAIYLLTTTATGGNWTLSDICIISGNTSGGMCVRLETVLGVVTNLRLSSGGGTGLSVLVSGGTKTKTVWSGIRCHSNSSNGLLLDVIGTLALSNIHIWRNNATGFFLTSVDGLCTVDTASIFGNATANIGMTRGSLRMLNGTIAGDTTFSTPSGWRNTQANTYFNLSFENCTFGVTSGIFVAHTTASIQWFTSATPSGIVVAARFINSLLADATEESNAGALGIKTTRAYQRVDQVTNIHKVVYMFGTVTRETTTIHGGKIGVKMEPTSATLVEKLLSGDQEKKAASGATILWSVWVRKNGAYAGNPPRLVLRANAALGIDSDVVLDTFTAAADTWENLTGTSAAVEENGVERAYVDCDGTAGEVYVGDWSAV